MSVVAEFAREIYNSENRNRVRSLTPVNFPAGTEKLYDIKAVIFDIYGTLVNYWHDEFSDEESKKKILIQGFKKTSDYFGFTNYLEKLNPSEKPESTLYDFYHGLLGLNHEKNLKKGISYPEIRVEEVWEAIILILARHGYEPEKCGLGDIKELSRCAAYYYNFHSINGHFYEGVVDALYGLKKSNIKLGLFSNAQFYVPVDLTLYIRDQSKEEFVDYLELFDSDLIFLSFEYGVTKLNQILLRRLYDALYELQILPNQTVFIGNDLLLDIEPAQKAGMHTGLFTGDDKSTFIQTSPGGSEIIPDIVFDSWEELPDKLNFSYVKMK